MLPPINLAFLDVGQGDTTIINNPATGQVVIVDCADSISAFNYLQKLKTENDYPLNLQSFIITHLHLDHFKGAIELIKRVEKDLNLTLKCLFFNLEIIQFLKKQASSNKRKNLLLELHGWAQQNRERFKPPIREFVNEDNLPEFIEFLHPWAIDMPELIASNPNNASCVIKVKGTNTTALLTGDLEIKGWNYLLQSLKQLKQNPNEVLACDVLKFPHHGGAWSQENTEALLDIVKPDFIVISVGSKQPGNYSHPNQAVFDAIKAYAKGYLLCTQVTNKCTYNLELIQKDIIQQHIQQTQTEKVFSSQQTGCPCAGTVIFELGATVQCLQPSIGFHKSLIAKNFDTPQCLDKII